MGAAGRYMRSTLFPSLPADAIVMITSREAPEPGSFEGGYEIQYAVGLPLVATRGTRRARCSSTSLEDNPA